MNKDLKKLAVMGIASGVIFSAAQADAAGYRSGNDHQSYAGRNGCGGGNGGYRDNGDNDDENDSGKPDENESSYFTPEGDLNEEGLLSQLSEESKRVYKSLDESEKQLVQRLAKQFHDKNAAIKEAQKQVDLEKEKAQAERPRRPITRHSLFR